MDLLFEIILELILEGSINISSNKKISKFIRYPIILILILLFGLITFGLIFLGFTLLDESILGSILLIITGLILLIGCIYKLKKTYLERK